MSEKTYRFYMQECTAKGVIIEGSQEIDLENYPDFEGLRYSKAEGLDRIGKPRVYTEKFSDSDRLRVHIPSELTNDATTVDFTFFFVGEKRRTSYHNFVEYVRKGYKVYHDDARRKYLYFFVNSDIAPATEQWYGSTPYLELKLTVQNIFGRTFDNPIK